MASTDRGVGKPWYRPHMSNSTVSDRIALCVGALSVVGMGLVAGCSAKESPAPASVPAPNAVDSKVSRDGGPSSFAPGKSAAPAPTVAPADQAGSN